MYTVSIFISNTYFQHWSVCVRINTEVEVSKRTPCLARTLNLSRVGNRALSSSEIWNYGFMFVSAKVFETFFILITVLNQIKVKGFAEAHQSRLCRINNSLDLKWKPFEGRDVAKFAMTCVGHANYFELLVSERLCSLQWDPVEL